MTQVRLPSGTRNTMAYSGTDQRVEKQESAGTAKFVWDGQKLLAETDGSNVVQVVYTQSPNVYGNVISQRRGGKSRYYYFDGSGSTDRLTDASQAVTDNLVYDAWGTIKSSSGWVAGAERSDAPVQFSFPPSVCGRYESVSLRRERSGELTAQ